MLWSKMISTKPTKPLYHYTTIDGLVGIFSQEKLWATSIFHLNDKSELTLAAGMFGEGIDELAKRTALPPEPAKAPPDYQADPRRQFLTALAGVVDIAPEVPIFVSSFSEARDQLSQWRGYCSGAYGFCIEFDPAQLEKSSERQRFLLARCIYNEDKQKRLITEYIKQDIEPRLSVINDANLERNLMESVLQIFLILPILKHDAFSEEKEWRLIGTLKAAGRRLKFRSGRTTVIPYYEFELTAEKDSKGTLPVKSIIVGPTPNEAQALQAVRTLLKQKRMPDQVEVVPSRIPYREI